MTWDQPNPSSLGLTDYHLGRSRDMGQDTQAPSDSLPLGLMDSTPTMQVGPRTRGQATQALPEPSIPEVHGSSTHHAGRSKNPRQATWAPSHLELRDPDPSSMWAQGSGPEDPGPSGLPIPRAHGSSTHHAGRPKNLSQVTQALLDPHPWGCQTFTYNAGRPKDPHPWGLRARHPAHR